MPFLFAYFETTDLAAAKAATLLLEDGRTCDIENRWSFRADPPHTTGMAPKYHPTPISGEHAQKAMAIVNGAGGFSR
jgi:hypothetical protein